MKQVEAVGNPPQKLQRGGFKQPMQKRPSAGYHHEQDDTEDDGPGDGVESLLDREDPEKKGKEEDGLGRVFPDPIQMRRRPVNHVAEVEREHVAGNLMVSRPPKHPRQTCPNREHRRWETGEQKDQQRQKE